MLSSRILRALPVSAACVVPPGSHMMNETTRVAPMRANRSPGLMTR